MKSSQPADEPEPREPATTPKAPPAERHQTTHLETNGPTLDETALADDFAAGTDAPLGRAGVDRALANG